MPAFLAKWAKRGAGPRLAGAARAAPDRQWRKVTYGEAKRRSMRLTQALLDRGFGPGKPVMILSANSIEFALLTHGGDAGAAPAAPVSPAYSVMSQDHAKLRYIVRPDQAGGGVRAERRDLREALAALDLEGVTVVHVARPCEGIKAAVERAGGDAGHGRGRRIRSSGSRQDRRQAAVHLGQHRHAQGGDQHPGDDVRQCRHEADGAPRGPDEPPAPCWTGCRGTTRWAATPPSMPILAEGGTTYIDDGKPLPGLFEETLRNLREISPTYYANVPAGYAMLATALEKDEALCRSFFRNLGSLAYGGATLPADLYERMEALAVRPPATAAVRDRLGLDRDRADRDRRHWASERVGLIGLPFPGVAAEAGADRRGWAIRDPAQERDRDAGLFPPARPHGADVRRGRLLQDRRCRPLRRSRRSGWGLIFDGRVVEDFKLTERHLRAGRHPAHRLPSPRRRPVLQDAGDLRPGPRITSACWACPTSPPAGGSPATPRRSFDGRGPASRRGRLPEARAGAQMNRRGRAAAMRDHAGDADGRAALGRRQRDHRQGLHQPARHARAPQGAGGDSSMPISPARDVIVLNCNVGTRLQHAVIPDGPHRTDPKIQRQLKIPGIAHRIRIASPECHHQLEVNAMNFDFSDEQKQMRDAARKFLAEKCPPKAVREVLDGKAPYDKAIVEGPRRDGLSRRRDPRRIRRRRRRPSRTLRDRGGNGPREWRRCRSPRPSISPPKPSCSPAVRRAEAEMAARRSLAARRSARWRCSRARAIRRRRRSSCRPPAAASTA